MASHTIALKDLALLANGVQRAVYRIARLLAGEDISTKKGQVPGDIAATCTLQLTELRKGSLVMEVRVPEQDQTSFEELTLGERAVHSLVAGLDQVRTSGTGMPRGYDAGVLMAWRETARLLGDGISAIRFSTSMGGTPVASTLDHETNSAISRRLRAPVHNMRVVEGRLLMGDFKETNYRCRVDPAVGTSVRCTFDESHEDAVLEALTHMVRVTGEATEKDGKIAELKIADIEMLSEDASKGGAPVAASFQASPTIEELAEIQNVRIHRSVDDLYGDFWPEDESADDFVASMRSWRDYRGI